MQFKLSAFNGNLTLDVNLNPRLDSALPKARTFSNRLATSAIFSTPLKIENKPKKSCLE